MAERRFLLIATVGAITIASALGWTSLKLAENEPKPVARVAPGTPAPLVLPSNSGPEIQRAVGLYREGQLEQAREEFSLQVAQNPGNVEAAVGVAMTSWPDGVGAVRQELEVLRAGFPGEPVVLLQLAVVDLVSGQRSAPAQLRAARTAALGRREFELAKRADDLSHPRVAPGYPPVLVTARDADRQADQAFIARLRRAVVQDDRPASRQLADQLPAGAGAEARIAAAMGAYDKSAPGLAERRLRDIGRSSTATPGSHVAQQVRLHQALLALWAGNRERGVKLLRITAADAPETAAGSHARRILRALSRR